uniref:Uncharacterized protein n=1 Tax=viral metagenome TaxID=1070528 RepID=A0A6M3M9F3_9ZZZZ
MKAEVETYIKQRDLRTALIAEKESIKDVANRQEADAEQQRDKKINTIRDRCFEETGRIREKAKALTEPIDQGIRELDPKIQDINRKIEFLKHREKISGKTVHQFDHESIKPYHDREIVSLGTLYEDEFTIMKLFAAENDRPKNRWTLMAIGDTLLQDLLKMPHEYGLPIHTSWFIQKALKHLPTLEEIKAYVEGRRKDLMRGELAAYEGVKRAYLDTINNYSLEDFKPLLEPRKVSDHEAPVTFKITGIGYALEYRLYQGFYYRTGGEAAGDPFDYIEVDDVTYVRYCRPEQLRITETGNTMFGDWWSVSIRKDPRGIVFNRKNWERTIAEATSRIDEVNVGRRKPVHFNPDEVEWITPIADEFFSTPKL